MDPLRHVMREAESAHAWAIAPGRAGVGRPFTVFGVVRRTRFGRRRLDVAAVVQGYVYTEDAGWNRYACTVTALTPAEAETKVIRSYQRRW